MPDPNRETAIEKMQYELLHLQRELEQLGGVVLDQGKQIDKQNAMIGALRKQVSLLKVKSDQVPDVRDPLSEKPPHY